MNNAARQTDDSFVTRRLPNGMTVALERLPYLHSAAAGVWVKTGSANETAERSGVSHLLEHLFFKGTASRSTRELMDAIEARGGHLNAFTSREYTCIYANSLDTHVATVIEILADIAKNSRLNDFEKERNVVLEEITSNMDVPEDRIHDLFAQRLWPGHSLGRPVAGTAESVASLTLEDVRSYYEAWYAPENMVFSVAGNIDTEAVFDQVRAEFEPLAEIQPPARCPAPIFGAGVTYEERDIAQNHVCFGFPGPAASDDRRYIYDMLSNALGGGFTSRLFERIREHEGLAYSVYTFHSCYLSAGMFGVYAATAPENLPRVLDLSCDELRKLRETPVSPEELESNREQLKGTMFMALESTFNRMSRMAKSLLYHGRIIGVDEVVERIDAVTADDIQALAQELFDPGKCAMAVLAPLNGRRVEALPL
ncbi:MAG TPA: insulinase family protein [Candidatus Hydrogenedentes bacterium]|nr:insulinase family protein [Candidatus Hydrogenedentota bacterium]HIJ73165.1 insulinase family protein [Candidatus Hydrogenedentota bacterium]